MSDLKRGFINFEVKSAGDEDTLTFIGSDETVDRYNEVIKQDGWELDNYRKNPVVMLFHDYSSFPVAKATRVESNGKQLIFDIQFIPGTEEYGSVGKMSQEVKALYKGGYMNTVSVGAMPLEVERPAEKDAPSRVYVKSELVELSLVPVPANPNALLVGRGIESAVQDGVMSVEGARAMMKMLEATIGKMEESEHEDLHCEECGEALVTICQKCINDQEGDCDCGECEDCKALAADEKPSIYDLLLGIRSETKNDSKEDDPEQRLIKAVCNKPTSE